MFRHKRAKLRWVRLLTSVAGTAVLAGVSAQAQELAITVEVPRLQVAEYHRPYIAIWLEPRGGGDVTNLALWYDTELKDNEGEKWLKDMRQWWRRSGRALAMPVDGVSGATHPPGGHTMDVPAGKLNGLAAGEYRLMVEAAREVGGREMLNIPFTWPAPTPQSLSVKGEHELGEVTLKLEPASGAN